MKKNHFILCIIVLIAILSSCRPSSKHVQADFSCLDSITVYGNTHLVQSDILPYDLQEKGRKLIMKVQKWQYQQISEDIVVIEGVSMNDKPYTKQDVYDLGGVTTAAKEAAVKEFVENYETGVRFILEGKKLVYGGENDSLAKLQTDALILNPQFAKSAEFKRLNDARSEQIAKIAALVCTKNQKRVAIIIGSLHLEWFENRGYNVKYPPKE